MEKKSLLLIILICTTAIIMGSSRLLFHINAIYSNYVSAGKPSWGYFLATVFGSFFSFSIIISSIFVLMRKNWARMFFIWQIATSALSCLYLSVKSLVFLSFLRSRFGTICDYIAHSFDIQSSLLHMLNTRGWYVAGGIAIYGYILIAPIVIIYLTRSKVKKQFI